MKPLTFRTFLVCLSCLVLVQCATSRAFSLRDFEKQLTATGVEGEIHAAVPDSRLYVFTFRNPENFFEYVHMSIVPASAAAKEQMKTLSRHDRVRIHGRFLENPSPQKHIAVESIDVVNEYESQFETLPYQHRAHVPEDLQNKAKATFLVHAVHSGGHILVVEYKDAVLPIFVRDPSRFRNLSRNDIVKLQFRIQEHPRAPTHLELDEDADHPIEIIESIADLHEKEAQVEGALVLFPQSPQVLFNVFAVLDETHTNFKRQYTLVNFDDPAVFKQIREKLQKAWDTHPTEYVNGRNKLISQKIRVKAKGRFNQVDPNQANTQILLSSPDAIEIVLK